MFFGRVDRLSSIGANRPFLLAAERGKSSAAGPARFGSAGNVVVLCLDDSRHELQCYVPEGDATAKDILRGERR
jgi:hypothetical protein